MNDTSSKIRDWSTHLEFLVLFVTLVGSMYLNISRIDQTNTRLDVFSEQMNARIDQANARSDQLYTMFYDLLKETKKKGSNE